MDSPGCPSIHKRSIMPVQFGLFMARSRARVSQSWLLVHLRQARGPARLWVRHPAGGSLAGCPRCTAWLINGVLPGRVSLAGSGSRGVCFAGSSSALLAVHCD